MKSLFEFVYWPHVTLFLTSWGTFIIAAVVSFISQLVYNRSNISLRNTINIVFPLDGWSTKSARVDLVMHIVFRLCRRFYIALDAVVALWVAIKVAAMITLIDPQHNALGVNYIIIIGCSLIAFLVCDLASYGSHYLRHVIPVLWELHKVHHSATFLSPATAARIHPLETVIDRFIIAASHGISLGFFRFLFGLSDAETLIMIANVQTIGYIAVFEELKHSHFAVSFRTFDPLFYSPRMHQVHHSGERQHFNRNFGDKLSIWDAIFGTLYVPHKSEEWEYGLGSSEGQDYQTLTGVYLGPLIKIQRRYRS